jgi:hypothetical protein
MVSVVAVPVTQARNGSRAGSASTPAPIRGSGSSGGQADRRGPWPVLSVVVAYVRWPAPKR